MKRICLLALIFSAATFAGEASHAPQATPAPAPGEPAVLDPAINKGILPEHYGALPLLWIPKLKDPAQFDGTLGDAIWNGAAQIELRDTISGKKPKLATRGYMFCTDAALYFGVRCAEPRLDELQTTEGEIGKRDSIEIFIEPYKDTLQKPYYHIMLDASGAIETAHYHVYPHLHRQPHLEGTPWKPNLDARTARHNDEWTLELRVPFDQLALQDAAQKKQTLWRMNIFRTRPEKPLPKTLKKKGREPRISWAWSPPGANLYHSAGKFGYVLPESMATPEFIQEVCKTANPPPVEEKPVDEAEVAKRLAELGSGDFDTRLAASQRLLLIANAGPATLATIQEKLEALMKSTQAVETWAMARDTFDDLKRTAERINDDDPPPPGFE